ncbi:hypothetical protein AMAG_15277 [Allomyces macrogynus ATCC 38327]|uniref:Uncharacterized protein n=1 Tax=Allomyces macrogynus (strain ATCC 38327) TaxID=578462 RepID=A0A0L0T905_ALLM3|nr:hypothetical protein AMAG_15277 [Allomyces macrogynus ATCC 38327]|eukprot:KNE71019.1 hypothetical protein AMAG_15277 [Allomyces macrogynus ATCC 38327]
MIEYSLVHIFDWIGHLRAQYPTEAPVIALMRTSATSYPHWQCSLPEFTAPRSSIAMGPKDPDKFQDGGRFGKPFDPESVGKVMVHRNSGKNNEKWNKQLQNGVVLDGLVTYTPIRQGL